ncbi:efflux RND transporter periplasmic adaptor subunit [Granulicella arctica]|uniref:RND family efflux transporter MFP subunit n=1 Tax=Granulicella arctica TaxID=940613 RepID=A0A7Y9TFC2_9BACT|nr:efflux RND transporter periplasmic adaptor subunit [Granulicella arctica]NYF78189.1 RND family efflux transporter MFP subunit [Granulicella arctica]
MTTPSNENPTAVQPGPPKHGLSKTIWVGLAVIVIVLLVVIAYGVMSRAAAERALEKQTTAAAVPTVDVVHPSPSKLSDAIALPGNTQAYTDTPIYARTSGYLKKWYFDIGARVKKGQLMAEIETPELDQQLQVAEADLKSSEANLNLANTTSERYQNLLKSNSVSKQETDQAMSDAAAKQAAVEASNANVRRLKQLQSFENVYAPFDGIVTARRIDIGSLIAAGQNTTPQELFHLAAIGQIRVYVSVPEVYSTSIVDGGEATLTLDEYPGQKFEGKITRNSNAIDPGTRTLNVEVDVANPKGLLLPGAYVFVHFKVPDHVETLSLPSNTLLFRSQGLQVGVVRDGKAVLVPVTISRDMGAIVEIGTGVTASDNVIVDPSDSLATGQSVHISDTSKSGDAQ